MANEKLEGACHCGSVKWQFDGDPVSATACNCTICRRYGVLWIYDFENERIKVSGPTTIYICGKALSSIFAQPAAAWLIGERKKLAKMASGELQ